MSLTKEEVQDIIRESLHHHLKVLIKDAIRELIKESGDAMCSSCGSDADTKVLHVFDVDGQKLRVKRCNKCKVKYMTVETGFNLVVGDMNENEQK